MSDVVRRSVSVALLDPDRADTVLLVQRPLDDEDLPGVWGLPASSLGPGEDWTEAVVRTGAEKLGVILEPGELLRQGTTRRARYTLDMRLYSARIIAGTPTVPMPYPHVTQYSGLRWGPFSELRTAAERGSLCARPGLEWHRFSRPGR